MGVDSYRFVEKLAFPENGSSIAPALVNLRS
jgi:hypothetical protein